MQSRWFLGVALGSGLAGCGLGLSGLGALGAAADAGAASVAVVAGDAGAGLDAPGEARDGGGDRAIDDARAPTCAEEVPVGWWLTLYATTRASCPTLSAASHDAVAGGEAGAGACSCTCEVSGGVTCETGSLMLATGATAAACATAGAQVAVSSELCAALPQPTPMPAYLAVAALPPTGACASTGAADPTVIARHEVRLCDVDGPAAASVCEGAPPPGFATCIAHAGAESCPSDGAFLARTLVSDDVTLTCSPCSACAVTGTCAAPTVAFFTGAACGSAVIAVAADGTCSATDVESVAVGSVVYNATLLDGGSGCAPGAATASLSPAGALTTLCCR